MPINDDLLTTLPTILEVPSAESPHRSLSDIKEDIAQCQENYAQAYLTIGKLLIEAKAQFTEHGQWLDWIKDNVELSVTKVQRLMKVARKFSNTALVPYLDFTKAYILSRLSERDIENLMNQFGGDIEKRLNR